MSNVFTPLSYILYSWTKSKAHKQPYVYFGGIICTDKLEKMMEGLTFISTNRYHMVSKYVSTNVNTQ